MAVAKTVKKTPSTSSGQAAKKVAPKKAAIGEFAVIMTGGKQYQVSAGETITIEKLAGEHKKGDSVTFDKVLLVDNGTDTTIGTPTIAGASVAGEITTIGRAAKVTVLKYKTGGQYKIQRGHRQNYTAVQVSDIAL